MRKRNIGFLSVCVVIVAVAAVGVFYNRETSLAEEKAAKQLNMEEWGKVLADNAAKAQGISAFSAESGANEEIYAVGNNGTILKQDVEQAKKFYLLSGLNEEAAQEKAVTYAYQREALYQEAIRQGYTVTDEEVWEYLEQLKGIIAEANNNEEAQQLIDQFDSEEAYWNYEFYVYQKNLPIEKYVKGKRDVFMQTAERDNKTADAAEEAWQSFFENLKEKLVEEENYKVL